MVSLNLPIRKDLVVVAQLVERWIVAPKVGGSIPPYDPTQVRGEKS